MTDACVITRVANGALNATTGDYATTSSQMYAGKCRLRGSTAGAASVRELQAGEAEQASNRYALLIPFGADSVVLVGDVATIGTRTFTVVGRIKATTTTAASLLVEEVEP